MKSQNIINLPNVITFLRLILVPFIIWQLLIGEFLSGFILFSIAGVSDFVDGWLARRLKIVTTIGAYMDPVADKLLMGSVYLVLGLLGHIPFWLVALVILRDILIIFAVFVAWLMKKSLPIAPILISKINTFAQISLAILVLANLGFGLNLIVLQNISYGLVGITTLISTFAYLMLWVKMIFKTKQP